MDERTRNFIVGYLEGLLPGAFVLLLALMFGAGGRATVLVVMLATGLGVFSRLLRLELEALGARPSRVPPSERG